MVRINSILTHMSKNRVDNFQKKGYIENLSYDMNRGTLTESGFKASMELHTLFKGLISMLKV